jgi:hypothetical protein
MSAIPTRRKARTEDYTQPEPYGLADAVLRALSHRQGRDLAITRPRLQAVLARSYDITVGERVLRGCITNLRKAGHLIGSAAAGDGGYYMIATAEELDEFLAQELLARITDLSETVNAMRRAGAARWDTAQPRLL